MTNTRYSNVGVILVAKDNAKIPIANTGSHAQVGDFTGNVAY